MKKILTLGLFISSFFAYSQGIIHIYNFSPYDLSFSLSANNQTNVAGSCAPSISNWGNAPLLPSGNDVTYLDFNNALVSTIAPVNTWRNYTGAGVNYPAPGPYPALNLYSSTTKWQGSKFEMKDPATGNNIPNGAFSFIGNLGCGSTSTPIPSVGGTGYPVFAEWFMVGTETYFIVQ